MSRKNLKSYLRNIFIILLILNFFYPQYAKRLIYPHLFGKKTDVVLQISEADHFEDVNIASFPFERNAYQYILEPKTAYAVTGRVGIVEHYDTLFYKFFRGQFQSEYMNLVPRDIFLVIGQMAREDVFEKFKFHHEERMGQTLCKGVKYRTSFLPSLMSEEKAKQNMALYQACTPYIKEDNKPNQEETLSAYETLTYRRKLFNKALVVLNSREKDILFKRRLTDKAATLDDLSKIYNISKERVRQIELNSIKKISKVVNTLQ